MGDKGTSYKEKKTSSVGNKTTKEDEKRAVFQKGSGKEKRVFKKGGKKTVTKERNMSSAFVSKKEKKKINPFKKVSGESSPSAFSSSAVSLDDISSQRSNVPKKRIARIKGGKSSLSADWKTTPADVKKQDKKNKSKALQKGSDDSNS
eukprot:10703432-Ditylum_brightwellii.AAC.1